MEQIRLKYLVLSKDIKPHQKVFVLVHEDEDEDKMIGNSKTWYREKFRIKELEVKEVIIEGAHTTNLSLSYNIVFDGISACDKSIIDIDFEYKEIIEALKTYIINHTEFKKLISF